MIDPVTFEACGAGRWYPANGVVLRRRLEKFVGEVDVNAEVLQGEVLGGIAPHAGLDFSGPVAGQTFAVLQQSCDRFGPPDLLVIIGFSHREAYEALALLNTQSVQTPMGTSPIATDAVEALCGLSRHVVADGKPHVGEHSAENLLPFVQYILPDCPLIVGLMGTHEPDICSEIVSAFRHLAADRRVLMVASTDLLHDPDYERVKSSDAQTLRQIACLDSAGLRRRWRMDDQVCCGIGPVTVLLDFLASTPVVSGRILRYQNCGDDYPETRGEWVVGYGSVVFELGER